MIARLVGQVGVDAAQARHDLRDFAVVVGVIVEARVQVEKLLICATAVHREAHAEAATELVDELAPANVLAVHGVLPSVENRLSLAVGVSHDDEDDAHQLPLRQLDPSVQLHLAPFVDDHDGSRIGCAASAPVLVQIMGDGFAAHQHCCAMPEGHRQVLAGNLLHQSYHEISHADDAFGLACSCGAFEHEAAVLQDQIAEEARVWHVPFLEIHPHMHVELEDL